VVGVVIRIIEVVIEVVIIRIIVIKVVIKVVIEVVIRVDRVNRMDILNRNCYVCREHNHCIRLVIIVVYGSKRNSCLFLINGGSPLIGNKIKQIKFILVYLINTAL